MYVPLEQVLNKTNNSIYKLAIIAGKRAIELAEGAIPLVGEKQAVGVRPVTLALKEIAEGKIGYKIVSSDKI